MKYKQVSKARYWEMLEVLWPAAWIGDAFLVGEAWDHGKCSVSGAFCPRYQALKKVGERYYEALAPMTVLEFRQEVKGGNQ